MSNMQMHNPAHPGVVLQDAWLKPLELSISETARRLGISRKHLSNIINEKAGVSADIAKRLEAFTGSSARMWLDMQVQYDLWQLRDVEYKNIEQAA